MMKILILFLGLLLAGISSAQNYTRDVGIRVGDYFTASFRQFYEEDKAIEEMLFVGRRGATAGIMKHFFQPAMGHISEYLYFQYGYGVHIGFRYADRYQVLNRTYMLDEYRFTPLLGVNGLIGLEYRFPEFPFILGLDLKPYFEYSTIQIFSIYVKSIGMSIKYRF